MNKAAMEKFWERLEKDYLPGDKDALLQSMVQHMEYSQLKTRHTAQKLDWYKCLALAIRDRVMEIWNETQRTYYQTNAKRVYYLSLEYLLGRTINNALINLKLDGAVAEALHELGFDPEEVIGMEPDAGLGNGGLGRLAACFLDSMATLQLPATGYGIRYDYGIFEQAIVDGFQKEKPDDWTRDGYPWELHRPEYTFPVRFQGEVRQVRDPAGNLRFSWEGGQIVKATAYDIPVPGYGNRTVNTLRLWSARASEGFDLKEFNVGEYHAAVEEKVRSENISKVLYPKDDIPPGKELRLKQEYFFVSATLQDIFRRFKVTERDFSAFPDRAAIQLNDTHPAIAIPELMRLLLDDEGLGWDQAWEITTRTFGYTNHTIMPEALETWPVSLMERLLPRHMQIIFEINRRFLETLPRSTPADPDKLRRMSIIQEQPEKAVRMAHLCIVGSHSVNGVAAIHTEILKESLFAEFYALWPERFNNKTNGITQRRWLKLCNPGLAALITEHIGEKWISDLDELTRLVPLAEDGRFQKAFREIKEQNKRSLAEHIEKTLGICVPPASLFDCQIKRIHEYKRQLLNVLHVITQYNRLKADPQARITPRTFLFAGKAAPGYAMAKLVIRLIHAVADKVNPDPAMRDKLAVVFLPNYSVSLAQKLIPASELSEQLSTAGYEASGTGNMKFALNGALTIGTLDGANVEIREEVGEDNIFIFGLTKEEVKERRSQGYNPWDLYWKTPELKQVLDQLGEGFWSPGQPDLFRPIVRSLLDGGDRYMLLADYQAYLTCQEKVSRAYREPGEWTRKAILNTARVGKFSSDRTIAQYAREIWDVTPVKPKG